MYFRWNVRYGPLDAVNLIFSPPITLKEVTDVLDDPHPSGNDQWITSLQSHQHLADIDVTLKQEDEHREKALYPTPSMIRALPGIGQVYTNVTTFIARYHIRLWQQDDYIVGAAHSDIPSKVGVHRVRSFNEGRDEVVKKFQVSTKGSFHIHAQAVYVGTNIDDPPHDGWATLITR